MTRVLGELLNAVQPKFSTTLQELERAAGRPSIDIALSSELHQRAIQKIREIGLDPADTTEEELYQALQVRVRRDEGLLRDALQIPSGAPASAIAAAVQQYVSRMPLSRTTFALKPSVAKRLIKLVPPKRAMKQLHYRSLDSMLKHEPIAQVYVAAFLCESLAWRKKFLDLYTTIQSSDFETREIAILVPSTVRWENLVTKVTQEYRQTAVVVKELGAVIMLPMQKDLPGLAITSFVQLTQALNDIASVGSYMKLQHVKPNFGALVRESVLGEPMTTARLVDRSVPWHVIHQYYARFKNAYNELIFEPHIQPGDLQWMHPEALLGEAHSALSFWHDTRYTAFKKSDKSVSLNVLDVALNYLNNVPFTERTSEHMRQQLWHELMVRYLNHENIEAAIVGELDLQPELVGIDD